MRIDDSAEIRALMSELRTLCAKLPKSEEYVMVHHPAFRVAKKPFVIAGMLAERHSATVTVNLGREMQSGLLGDPRFSRTPYIGQHGWVTVARDDLKKGELSVLVIESWRRVAGAKALAAYDGAAASKVGRTSASRRKNGR